MKVTAQTRWNFHTHSTWCDGTNTVEQMAARAAALGFEALGFSGHGYYSIATDYCMTQQNEANYLQEVLAQKDKYRGKMRIYAGLELEGQDSRVLDRQLYDYCLNSVHSIQVGGVWYAMDASPAALEACIREGFGGDAYRMAEEFFAVSAQTACARKPDIIGHFDLLTKFNENGRYFDEQHPRYLHAALQGVREANKSGAIFEINSGAISRGIAGRVYPAMPLLKEICRIGGRVVISSDAHYADSLDFGFEIMEQMLYEAGFRETMCLTDTGWQPRPLSI